LSQQTYFAEHSVWGDLSVTDDVAARVISLPMFDTITPEEVEEVAAVMNREMGRLVRRSVQIPPRKRLSLFEAPALVAVAGD
jgi:hypothetical protein